MSWLPYVPRDNRIPRKLKKRAQKSGRWLDVNRRQWPEGPWHHEPDRIEWRSHGLPCLIARGPLGNLCGYVAVPPRHRAHGRHYDDVLVETHGGLTYAARCYGHICHRPRKGESRHVWWLGFDCAHAFDAVPSLLSCRASLAQQLGRRRPLFEVGAEYKMGFDTYRDVATVKLWVDDLAQRLSEGNFDVSEPPRRQRTTSELVQELRELQAETQRLEEGRAP